MQAFQPQLIHPFLVKFASVYLPSQIILGLDQILPSTLLELDSRWMATIEYCLQMLSHRPCSTACQLLDLLTKALVLLAFVLLSNYQLLEALLYLDRFQSVERLCLFQV